MWAGEERVGPVTVELSGDTYAGLVVCSHSDEVVETAVFRKVSVK
jgi:hypothetical protein